MVIDMVDRIVLSMLEFQRRNCIQAECMTNTQYLYNQIRTKTNHHVKVKAVVVISVDEEKDTFMFIGGHLILIVNGQVIDPSYDVFSLETKSYFDNAKDLLDSVDDKKAFLERFPDAIRNLLWFVQLEHRMNNGEFCISNREFYNAQADYVDKTKTAYVTYNI